jgi:hypothetical protein
VDNQRVRVFQVAAVLAGAAALMVVLAGPAGADMLVSQTTNLVDGQVVTVSGTDTTGASALNIYECSEATTPIVGGSLDTTQCDPNNVVAVTPASDGSYSTSFVFHDPFTSGAGQVVDCSVQSCEIVVDLVNPGDVVAFSMVTGNECNGFFMGSDATGFVKTADGGPSGAIVNVGETIAVTLDWSATTQFPFTPSKVTDCVKEISPDGKTTTIDLKLSQDDKTGPFPASGVYTSFSYMVPATVGSASSVGYQICDRGAVGSQAVNTLKSNLLCYTIASGAPLPEAPTAVLLPSIAVAVAFGGFLFVRWRRSRGLPAT